MIASIPAAVRLPNTVAARVIINANEISALALIRALIPKSFRSRTSDPFVVRPIVEANTDQRPQHPQW
jgi:hypothetical protein